MTSTALETYSGALFGVPILLPRTRKCRTESAKGQYWFMEELTQLVRAATPYKVRTLDRFISLEGTTVISPASMRSFEREMAAMTMKGKTAKIDKYVHAVGPGDDWPLVVLAIGVVARTTSGLASFSLPAPDVWQSMLAKLQGYLGFHVEEFQGAVIGQIQWIDKAIDDARRMLLGAGTRRIEGSVAGGAAIDGVTVTTMEEGFRVHLHNSGGVSVIDVPARNGADIGAEIAGIDESIRFLTGKAAVWGLETRH
ncbi:hypothetical protein DEE69_29975 [Ralstonia insidiosa]|jgi:hypothetical protein|nr:hypothetical protein [Ralstonia insidiosa]MBA9940876.1 hypothetical protein [Ralstonia insidiosa]MBC9969071.1 hypothetical protein [Ralstonia insidiosa]MBX3905298.1 hypothetical protein [Ralstonia insidiosa]